MRFAIVSDIHANMPAWKAVLTDIASNRVDRILCLGDAVGYGPNPLEVLSSLHQHVDAFCMGNHDAAACGKLDAARFNPLAATLVAWTQKKLPRRALDFMGAFPLTLTGEGFRCAHAEFSDPSAFNYILEPADALPSWNAAAEPLLFVGHSHAPGIHLIGASQTPHRIDAQDFTLEPGKRYIVNTGSVGHPRDGDLRACYVIHDTSTASVHFRRIPFDSDIYRAAIHAAGLPLDAAVFDRDPLSGLAQVRENDFFCTCHADDPAACAHDVTPAREISRHRRATLFWRKAALLSTLAAVASLSAAVLLARLMPRGNPAPRDLPPGLITTPAMPLPPHQPFPHAANLLPPIQLLSETSMTGWRCTFFSAGQRITAPGRTAPPIAIASTPDTPQYFRIESPPIEIPAGVEKARFIGALLPGEHFSSRELRFTIEELGAPDANGVYPATKARPHQRFPSVKSRREGPLLSTDSVITKNKSTRYFRVSLEGETTGVFTLTAFSLAPE